MKQHSPTPWRRFPYSGPVPNFCLFGITNGTNDELYCAVGGPDEDTAQANAEFVVKAVNAHDDLVAACRKALVHLMHPYSHYESKIKNEILAILDKHGIDEQLPEEPCTAST